MTRILILALALTLSSVGVASESLILQNARLSDGVCNNDIGGRYVAQSGTTVVNPIYLTKEMCSSLKLSKVDLRHASFEIELVIDGDAQVTKLKIPVSKDFYTVISNNGKFLKSMEIYEIDCL